jgi:hypothetical protein
MVEVLELRLALLENGETNEYVSHFDEHSSDEEYVPEYFRIPYHGCSIAVRSSQLTGALKDHWRCTYNAAHYSLSHSLLVSSPSKGSLCQHIMV